MIHNRQMKLFLPVLITVLFMQSCAGESQQETGQATQEAEVSAEKITDSGGKPTTSVQIPLPESLPVQQMPITDTTNFDNFRSTGIAADRFVASIGFRPDRPEAKHFRINYYIPFSDNFTALAITYQSGDHELFTTLLTLDTTSRIIDQLDIAYDEIAESAFQKTSVIQQDKIVVTSVNWMGEEPFYESESYVLQPDGKFSKFIIFTPHQ